MQNCVALGRLLRRTASTAVTGYVRSFGGSFAPQRAVALPGALFAAPRRLDLVHRVVTWWRACERAGLAASKGRGDVRGSNRKIHPQKGSGRARAGDARAPHRRGGGACFGPAPRSFAQGLPLKLRWLAFRAALSARWAEGAVAVVDAHALHLPTPRTADLAARLRGFVRPHARTPRKMLLLGIEPATAPALENLARAARSLDGALVHYRCILQDTAHRHTTPPHLRHPVNAFHLLRYHHICLTPGAIDHLAAVHARLAHAAQ